MSGRGSQVLEHPADLGIEVWAEDEAGLFEEAAKALTAIVLDPARLEPRESRRVKLSGEESEERMVRWLNEVLYLLDAERFAAVQVRCGAGEAELTGEPREDDRHPPRLVVKAATYHQLEVRRSLEGWRARVFFDI